MKIGVPKETAEREERVALVPETVERLLKKDFEEVLVESGAGRDYNLDEAYEEAGARVVPDADEVYSEADVVLKIRKPSEEEVGKLREGQILVCFLEPLTDPALCKKLAEQGVTAFSLESVPRIARAQSMDALSSMGSIGGYKSALIAADSLGRYLPMMTTAAGTTKAAKAMVLGVGVAGLQAISTLRRLGADVEAFDIRPEVKEQVESLGARFIDADDEQEESDEDSEGSEEPREPSTGEKLAGGLRALFGLPEKAERNGSAEASEDEEAEDDEAAEDGGGEGGDGEEEDTGGYATEQSEEKQERDRELLGRRIAEMDLILTTALVPGRKAPVLVTADMVESMKPGSVLVDLAAEQGGNCELTEPGEVVVHQQVHIHGPTDVASSMPIHASQLLSRNMASLLSHLVDEEKIELDFEDQITNDACITHDGELRHEKTREALESAESS